MPQASQEKFLTERPAIKNLHLGNSGTGKTGALASLLAEGYKVRVLDLDNNIGILLDLLLHKDSPYPKGSAERLHWITIKEPMHSLSGKIMPKAAKGWPAVLSQLNNWKDTSISPDFSLGHVSTWGTDCVLVIDTLTPLARFAWNYYCQLNGKLGADITGFEYQRYIGQVQSMLESFLDLISDTSIQCNVILNAHINYVRDPGEQAPKDGEADKVHGFALAIGKALSPKISRVFGTVLHFKNDELDFQKRPKIYTKSSGLINTKTSAPLSVKAEYPIATGLAEYFRAVRGPLAP